MQWKLLHMICENGLKCVNDSMQLLKLHSVLWIVFYLRRIGGLAILVNSIQYSLQVLQIVYVPVYICFCV